MPSMTRVLLWWLLLLLASPAAGQNTIRVATFNLEDVRTPELLHGDDPRLQRLAEVIQRIRPNVILLNEIAYDVEGGPGVPDGAEPGQNARRFVERYLAVAQSPGLRPIRFQAFMAPTNTGMASGFDLDRSGEVVTSYPDPPTAAQTDAGRAYGGDCWGFGTFPGQYGMALLVDPRLKIQRESIRTFRLLPWRYVPGAFLPTLPTEGDEADGEAGTDAEAWYDEETLRYFRLSSKSHWDVPVELPSGRVVHFLCSHPTPPAFDGPELRNQKRNHDEIRFWADYLSNEAYIVDDENEPGGLRRGSTFVILGDLNADPDEGTSFKDPIGRYLLANDRLADAPAPLADTEVAGLDADDTAAFGLRVDYVLPARSVRVLRSGVWRRVPDGWDSFPSDHFPVWADLRFPEPR